MDTDAERTDSGPFDDRLTPAVREIGAASDIESVLDVEDHLGPRRTLDPTIRQVWVLQSIVPALVVGGLVAVALAFLPVGSPWVGSVVAVILFVVSAGLAVLRYRSWSYEVREDSLYLERGVVTNVTTVVPYVRIQHVDARRGPIERAFGLATTVVYTAGSRGADVSIPGLSPERAEDLQNRLKQLAIAAEGEDAV